jgi:uncharacterized LabA/DUF88 family protein
MRTMIFVDGENLTFRYQDMRKNGRVPSNDITHVPDVFVWHPDITKQSAFNVQRVSYYTSMAASLENIEKMKDYIGSIFYHYEVTDICIGNGQICPYIFKKEKQKDKTRKVDINITIDTMRYAFSDIDLIVLISGDGDFIPLIEEIMHKGKRVWVYAFSSGLDRRLRYISDEFKELDDIFFLKPEPPSNES